jgi:hypothetical protein
MKRLALKSCMAVLALAQTPVRHGEFRITAATANQTGPRPGPVGKRDN